MLSQGNQLRLLRSPSPFREVSVKVSMTVLGCKISKSELRELLSIYLGHLNFSEVVDILDTVNEALENYMEGEAELGEVEKINDWMGRITDLIDEMKLAKNSPS